MDYAHYISYVPHGGTVMNSKFQLVYDDFILPKLEILWKERKEEFNEESLTIPSEIPPLQFLDFLFDKLYPMMFFTGEPAKEIKEFLSYHNREYCSQNNDCGDFHVFLEECILHFECIKKTDPGSFKFRFDKNLCDEIIRDWINISKQKLIEENGILHNNKKQYKQKGGRKKIIELESNWNAKDLSSMVLNKLKTNNICTSDGKFLGMGNYENKSDTQKRYEIIAIVKVLNEGNYFIQQLPDRDNWQLANFVGFPTSNDDKTLSKPKIHYEDHIPFYQKIFPPLP